MAAALGAFVVLFGLGNGCGLAHVGDSAIAFERGQLFAALCFDKRSEIGFKIAVKTEVSRSRDRSRCRVAWHRKRFRFCRVRSRPASRAWASRDLCRAKIKFSRDADRCRW